MRPLSLTLALALLAGCPPDPGNDTTDGKPGDSGDDTAVEDTGGLPDYGPAGCININGETGDFATIQEGIDAAIDGTTVNVCAGAYAEALDIDKAVQVVGAGSTSTTLAGPESAHTVNISAGGGISGFTIVSTRSAVRVDSVAEPVTIADLAVADAWEWAIEIEDSLAVSISGCTFVGSVEGAVRLEGSLATVSDSTFTNTTSYGIKATDGSNLTAIGNQFTGVVDTDNGDKRPNKNTDGWAIYGENSEVQTSGNVITGGSYGGVKVEDGALLMSADAIADTPYGVVAIDSEFSGDMLEINAATEQGLYASHSVEPIPLTNSSIDATATEGATLVTCSLDYDVMDGWCGGAFLKGASVTLENLTISNYDTYGLYILNYTDGTDVSLSGSAVNLVSNGRWSLRTEYAEGALDLLSVTDHREPDSINTEPCYGYIDQGTAAVLVYSTITLTGATISGSEGWGLSDVFSNVTLSTSSIADNTCAGVINYQSNLVATENAFTGSGELGALFDYQGAVDVQGNTFTDTRYNYNYKYDDGVGGYYRYEYSGYGLDIKLYDSIEAIVVGNTFVGGDSSIEAWYVGADIQHNSWSGYDGNLVTVYYGDPGSPTVLDDAVADDIGGSILATYYGSAEAKDIEIGSTRAYTYSYAYYQGDSEGNETVIYEYEYSYGYPAFQAYGYYSGYWSDYDGDGIAETYDEYGEQGDLKLEDVIITSAYAELLQIQDSSLEINGLTAEAVGSGEAGSYTIYAYWDHYLPDVQVTDMVIGSSSGTGVYMVANTSEAGVASFEDVEFGSVASYGVYATGLGSLSLSQVEFEVVDGYGVYTNGDYSAYDYETATTESGTRSTATTLSDVSILAPLYDGITLNDGSATVSATSVTAGGSSGLSLNDLSADVQGNVFSGNTSYGMVCSNVTFSACATNDLSANLVATHSGCDDACGI